MVRWWSSTSRQPSSLALRARRDRQLGADDRAERRIDAVERHPALGGVERASGRPRSQRRRTGRRPARSRRRRARLRTRRSSSCSRVGRDQRHVVGVAAQEQRLAHAVVAGADHADALVGDLIAVADRAIADQPARSASSCTVAVHVRPIVDHAGGEQHVRARIRGRPIAHDEIFAARARSRSPAPARAPRR